MKISFFLLIILSLITGCKDPASTSDKTIDSFNQSLAQKLGADEYGMSSYVIAFLKRGPNRTEDKEKAAQLQAAHMSNIKRLADEGKLALAGPFLDDGDLRGIYIFNVDNIEEAKKLTESDPAIQAGSLTMELHKWYGSAAVKQINKIHKTIQKTKF